MNKSGFSQAIDTLRLYRRADIVDTQGQRAISTLYVDPLPEEHILKSILKPNTTILVGRKGTGKSTIFLRSQEALNTNKECTWAYIDIKTVFESSTSEAIGCLDAISPSLDPSTIRRLATFKGFVIALVKEIKSQINQRLQSDRWTWLTTTLRGGKATIFRDLDQFIEDIDSDQYINATAGFTESGSSVRRELRAEKTQANLGATVSAAPSAKADLHAEDLVQAEQEHSKNFSTVYLRAFKVQSLINKLTDILKQLHLKHLYIFVDDLSELPKESMEEVVDSLLAPFNNWSSEFIKLKIAVYPGRVYTGDIDISKLDQVHLDIYRAYGGSDVGSMEERAIDFTRRLVTTRIQFFCNDTPESYFESVNDDLWRTLFNACLGNPRILGYILLYSYESTTLYNKLIGTRTIQDAARKFYEEKVSHFFKINKFLHESFEERSSIYSLRELLEEIVKRAKSLRSYQGSKVIAELEGRPPTSHFHIPQSYDSVLSTLELNFFVTKYYEMKDRDGREVSVYALNFGLCQQQAISFGRPREKREHRLYFVERVFDYGPIITAYIKVNQEVVCDSCCVRHSSEALPAIQAFDMLCPNCRKGTCRVVNLSRKYEELIQGVANENLLPSAELGILKSLHDSRKDMFAQQIAAELDCSYQLVGKRGKILEQRDLVVRANDETGRRTFAIRQEAEATYFGSDPNDQLNFG